MGLSSALPIYVQKLSGGHRSSGAMELVWDNWKLYSEVPHGFSRNARGLCLMNSHDTYSSPISRRLSPLATGVVTDTI